MSRQTISTASTMLVAALLLSACGVKGSLKTPPPLWGDKPVADTPDETETSTPLSPTNPPSLVTRPESSY